MAAADNLNQIQFSGQQHGMTPPSLPPTSAPTQSHPELTDGSGFNAAVQWSAPKSGATSTNAP